MRLVKMCYFRYEDKQIYYEESGEGTPLILLHGNTSCGKMFDPILSKLADKYRVTVIDFLGGGRSDRVEKWPADLWFDWACQAKALCDHLGLKKVKLIGSSGGALAAFNFALEYPGYVDSFIADSFEGLKADPGIMEQLISGRAQAKTSGGFVKYLKSLHGDDWEQVFDADYCDEYWIKCKVKMKCIGYIAASYNAKSIMENRPKVRFKYIEKYNK